MKKRRRQLESEDPKLDTEVSICDDSLPNQQGSNGFQTSRQERAVFSLCHSIAALIISGSMHVKSHILSGYVASFDSKD